jgi:hypothetical protein
MVGDIGLDHIPVEVVGEVEDVVGDAQLLGHPSGILDVGDGTAAGVRIATPQLHGCPHDLVALLAQQERSDR